MPNVAHLRYEGGAIIMPAQNPYDREMLLQEAEHCARLHGAVRVQVGAEEMKVMSVASELWCDACDEVVGALSCWIGGRRLCVRCVRRRFHCARTSDDGKADDRPVEQAAVIAGRLSRTASLSRPRWFGRR